MGKRAPASNDRYRRAVPSGAITGLVVPAISIKGARRFHDSRGVSCLGRRRARMIEMAGTSPNMTAAYL
jgi:hypothetical protein